MKAGKQYKGRYAIANGFVCVQFDNKQARCDTILLKAGDSFVFVNAQGEKYPVRPK